jgi:hypothetical protein
MPAPDYRTHAAPGLPVTVDKRDADLAQSRANRPASSATVGVQRSQHGFRLTPKPPRRVPRPAGGVQYGEFIFSPAAPDAPTVAEFIGDATHALKKYIASGAIPIPRPGSFTIARSTVNASGSSNTLLLTLGAVIGDSTQPPPAIEIGLHGDSNYCFQFSATVTSTSIAYGFVAVVLTYGLT